MSPASGLLLLLLLLSLLSAPACGKKGPPRVPKKTFETAVLDLRGGWADGEVQLRGRISHPELEEEITGCRVSYAEFPPGKTPCETCPIEFQGSNGFGPEVVTEEGFLCRVPGKDRGLVYFFQVRLAGPGNVLGPPSNTVRVEPKQ